MSQRSYLRPADLAAWNEEAQRVALATGEATISSALTAAMKVIVDFDAIFLATLHRDAPPTVHYHAMREPGARYSEGPYLLDPFYIHFLNGGADGCYRLIDLAPQGFRRSEYFSTYYRHLEIDDELGLLVSIGPRSCAHVSIIRRTGVTRFTRRDCDWVNATAVLVAESTRRINATLAPPAADASAVHDSLRRTFHDFGASVLTEREREVTQLLLQGNSAKSIARLLNIAADTARNHLKHIYSKLGVASQTQLFALFIRVLERVEPGGSSD